MEISELITKSASEQRKALLNKEVSASELVDAVYKKVESIDEKIKSKYKMKNSKENDILE